VTAVDALSGIDPERELATTRAQLRHILKLDGEQDPGDRFPRSRTMRALSGGGAAPALVLVAVAILATRPGVAGRLARAAPVINLLRQVGFGLR
jgi:hypothetical protein